MKKKTIKLISAFSAQLFFILLILFAIQSSIQSHFEGQAFQHLIIEAYSANYFLVVFTFSLILFMKKKQNAGMGFVFFGGFLLKLAVFFIFFKGEYQADGDIQRAEFFSFFVPYSICLIAETYQLVKILNRS